MELQIKTRYHTLYLPEEQKSKTLTTANADKNVEQEHWLVEMQNGTTTMEDKFDNFLRNQTYS